MTKNNLLNRDLKPNIVETNLFKLNLRCFSYIQYSIYPKADVYGTPFAQ